MMKPEDVVKIGLGIFDEAMPKAELPTLMDCIREQEWESDEERDLALKEIAEWLDEHRKWGTYEIS